MANFAQNYLAGRQAVVDEEAARQQNALRGYQVQNAMRANALAQNPSATPEDYIRAGDTQTGAALAGVQEKTQNDKAQAVQQLGAVAQRALTIADPQGRRAFVHQAMSVYAPAFHALGVDPAQGQNSLDQYPDAELEQTLQQFSKFAPPAQPIKLGAGEALVDPNSPTKPIVSMPVKPHVEYKDAGDRLIPVDEKGVVITSLPPIMKNLTPDQKRSANNFNSDASDLLASLASAGVSLPAGLRSKEQQVATLQGLLRKFPGISTDEIAQKVASGQVDFGAIKKETQTAAGQAGRVAIATNELNTFAPIVLDASSKVPRGSFIPINKLLQMGETSISDPNLLQLKISINSMLNAYDQLAARGGTDMSKREHAHSLLTSAQSPEALAAGISMFQREAGAAGKAAAQAERYHAPGEVQTPTTNVPPQGQVLTATGPNGQKLYLRNGQWVAQ